MVLQTEVEGSDKAEDGAAQCALNVGSFRAMIG